MKLTKEQKKQLVIDYNEGNGPSNLELAKTYGVSNTCVRSILITKGVYKPQRFAIRLGYIPDAYEIRKIRDENKIMRATLKTISNCELPEEFKALVKATLELVTKKQKETV